MAGPDAPLRFPDPVPPGARTVAARAVDPAALADPVAIEGTWGEALALRGAVVAEGRRRFPPVDYAAERRARAWVRGVTRMLHVAVEDGIILLRGAPGIPWLRAWYGGRAVRLALADLLAANTAWQTHVRGVALPGLTERVHPGFGVYAPSRVSHLVVFDRWLSANARRFRSALDLGTGSGALLGYLLARLPASARLAASDISPNAVASVREDLVRKGLSGRVELACGHAAAGLAGPFDLVVLNPPWLPGEPGSDLDAAMFAGPDGVAGLVRAAVDLLAPQGRLAVLFSNFARLAGAADAHPVGDAVGAGLAALVSMREAPVTDPLRCDAPAWRRALRARERVELWELRRP